MKREGTCEAYKTPLFIAENANLLPSYHRGLGGSASFYMRARAFEIIGELTKPRRRRQQKADKFAYLRMKNSIIARFARAFFIF